jgi:diguanylate cyclase (GGDEF)-like protein
MIESATNLLLGTDPPRRLRVERYLYALVVYLFCAVLEFFAVQVGLVSGVKASLLFAFIFIGQLTFFLAIRTGWSARLDDPALSMPQMAFANVAIGLAYVVNESGHGMMTMLMALVLTFSAFILSPRNCRRLSWLCVASLAGAMVVARGSLHVVWTPNVEGFHFMMSAVVLPTIGHLTGQLSGLRFRLQSQRSELRSALEKVRKLATHDELTGLPNRRHALELLTHEERKTTRAVVMPCLGLLDIDYFKRVNDTLGHPAGDETLRLFASLLGNALRPGDVLARWGGEEFLIMLPGTPMDEATRVLERLRERCADPAHWATAPHLRVTFSAGLTSHIAGESTQASIARADSALYRAKAAGRNRVEVA